METKSAKIIITIIKKGMYFDSCRILGLEYNFNEIPNNKLTIVIPDKEFGMSKEKEKILIDFELTSRTQSQNIKFKFNAYYGTNRAYCFLSSFKHTNQLYEFYFYEPIKVMCEDIELKETDSFDDDSRTRMILINPPNNIIFNKIPYNTAKFSINFISDSFEVSIFDISKNYFASKIINDREKFSVIESLKSKEKNLNKLYEDFKKLNNKQEEKLDEYSSIINYSGVKEITINFSQKKSILQNEFKNEDDYRIMYLYLIWYSLGAYCSKIKTLIEKNNKNDKKEKIEYIKIKDILEIAEKLYNEYLNDKDLLIYEKIMLIYSNILFLLRFPNINTYKESKLKYIKKKDIKEKSVFGISYNFIENFIQKLNCKSYLFYPLLLLDSGLYKTINDESIYGFNLETCDNLKNHLKELIPDVFFIYEEKTSLLKAEGGFNYKGYGTIFINVSLSLNEYKKNPILDEYNNLEEERNNKHYGMRISKVMMHESFCHNKFIFEYKSGEESPMNFYNVQMNLIKIVPVNYPYLNDDNEYLRGSKSFGKGESGKFFEYFFGIYFNQLIIDLLYEVEYIGKLVDNVEYFLKDNLDTIKNYIICKYEIKAKNVKYDHFNNLTLEEEIKNMKILINNRKLELIGEKNIEKNISDNNVKKSSDILYGYTFIEELKKEEEYKGYNYYKKKAEEAKNLEEFFEYSQELVFNHLKTV